jgi:predicted transcriptional regulator
METTITDSQKIQTILDELSISSYRLTQELNLSASAIYHVLSGKNQLSMNLIDKICTQYPEVNKNT